MFDGVTLLVDVVDNHADGSVEGDSALVVGNLSLLRSIELQALAFRALAELGDVVEAENHILRRHGDRRAVGGVEDVVGAEHQHLGFKDGLVAKRQMDGHLVAVEVGVERRTCQRVELDCLTLDHLGLEGLDTETVKCRGSVEEHGMTFHHVFEDIPYHGLLAVYNLLGRLDGLDDAALDELADHEGFVELGSHVFGNTALVHLQFGAYDDNRTGGVVDALTEKVLTEAALLALERVGERLERTVGVGLYGRRLARVVEQRVDSFLEHALLVAENHLGSLDFDEALEAVVADYDATVEVVEVGSGEAAAVEGHERTQVGRNHGHGLENHPFGLVTVGRRAERLDHLKALERFGLALLRAIFVGGVAQSVAELVEVDVGEEVENGLGTHLGHKLVGVVVGELAVALGQTLDEFEVVFLGEEVHFLELIGERTGVEHDVALIVYHCVELLRGETKKIADLIGKRAEIPDVGHGHHKLDVAHALAAHFLFGDFHAATVADDALVADALVFSAMALIVLYRTEDALAEEAVALGLVGAVVDGFGLEHLA